MSELAPDFPPNWVEDYKRRIGNKALEITEGEDNE